MDLNERAQYVFSLPDGKIVRELDMAMKLAGMSGLTAEQEAEFRDILKDLGEKSSVARWIAEGSME